MLRDSNTLLGLTHLPAHSLGKAMPISLAPGAKTPSRSCLSRWAAEPTLNSAVNIPLSTLCSEFSSSVSRIDAPDRPESVRYYSAL